MKNYKDRFDKLTDSTIIHSGTTTTVPGTSGTTWIGTFDTNYDCDHMSSHYKEKLLEKILDGTFSIEEGKKIMEHLL